MPFCGDLQQLLGLPDPQQQWDVPCPLGTIPPFMLSARCRIVLHCSLPLSSSPSIYSCTAVSWTRSWRNHSWVYQGQRRKGLLHFTCPYPPSPQPTAPPGSKLGPELSLNLDPRTEGQGRATSRPHQHFEGGQPGAGCSLQHREPSLEQCGAQGTLRGLGGPHPPSPQCQSQGLCQKAAELPGVGAGQGFAPLPCF